MLEMFWFINQLIWPVYVAIGAVFVLSMALIYVGEWLEQRKGASH